MIRNILIQVDQRPVLPQREAHGPRRALLKNPDDIDGTEAASRARRSMPSSNAHVGLGRGEPERLKAQSRPTCKKRNSTSRSPHLPADPGHARAAAYCLIQSCVLFRGRTARLVKRGRAHTLRETVDKYLLPHLLRPATPVCSLWIDPD